jgi:hypothetical protein
VNEGQLRGLLEDWRYSLKHLERMLKKQKRRPSGLRRREDQLVALRDKRAWLVGEVEREIEARFANRNANPS